MFRVLTIVSITVSLTVISIAQRDYILEAETPPVETCYYYDEYGNYIHGSRLIYNCPVPEVLQTEDSLSMTFNYTYFGSGNGYNGASFNDTTLYQYRKVEDGASSISVEIHYTDDNIIDYYRLREVTNYRADDYTKTELNNKEVYNLSSQTYVTNYYEVIIDTDFSDGVIIQNKKVFQQTGFENIVDQVTDFSFKDFTNEEPRWEMEYRINYSSVSEGVYEFLIYQYTPTSGYDKDNPTYEGMVDPIFGGSRIYFENEQTEYGTLEFSSQMYTYMTNSITNTSSFIRKYYSSILEYDFDNLGDNNNLSILTKKNDMHLEDLQNEDDLRYSYQNYNGFIYFESQFKSNLLYQTDYGYRVETYGSDGIRDESELSSSIGEIGYVNNGVDDRIISLTNPTNFFYRYSPIFDYNPMLKYLLNLNSSQE